jgi:molybdenum cofactor cytidylyltransferase
MGRPKMILPWGDTTVIGQVVRALSLGGVTDILVVTGGAQGEVEKALEGFQVRLAHNPHYASGDMLASLQTGLGNLPEGSQAALVALGDQPQIQPAVVSALLACYWMDRPRLVVPSYAMRRGHPWIVASNLWPEILAMESQQTLRDFLQAHTAEIAYLPVDTDSILADLDTSEDYLRQRPSEPQTGLPGLG